MPTDVKAVILAAGQGSRLRPAKPGIPKCLLEVGGKALIEHQLSSLDATGILDVLVVVGYKGEMIQRHVGNRVRYRICDTWESSNNFLTLWSIRDELEDGFVCFFADLLCDADPIAQVLAAPSEICIIVDTSRVLEGTMRVQIESGHVTGIGSHIPVSEGSGNFIGVAKFSPAGARQLLEQLEAMVETSRNEYYTVAVDRLACRGVPVGYVDMSGRPWVEIDTAEDLQRAHSLADARRT